MALTPNEIRLHRAILKLTRFAEHRGTCTIGTTATAACNCGLAEAQAEFAEANREAMLISSVRRAAKGQGFA